VPLEIAWRAKCGTRAVGCQYLLCSPQSFKIGDRMRTSTSWSYNIAFLTVLKQKRNVVGSPLIADYSSCLFEFLFYFYRLVESC